MALLGDSKVIPWIGFGTYLCTENEVETSGQIALNIGYKHIDTAEGYKTEQSVGNLLKLRLNSSLNLNLSESITLPFITTKLWPLKSDGNPKSYDEVIRSCEISLEKLGIPSIDLYLIHAPFGNKLSRIEQWKALIFLQESGKCKSIGVSNYSVQHLEEIREANLPLPSANQLELHPLCQHKDIVSYCKLNNILPIAYSSLAPLSDWRPGQRSGKLQESYYNPNSESNLRKIELFNTLATKYNITPAQLLLKWGLQHGYPILPKSNHESRIQLNFELNHFTIDEDDMNLLNELDENKPFAWPIGDPCLTP